MINKFLKSINEKEYLRKMNNEVIDGKTHVNHRITINEFLNSIRQPAEKYLYLNGLSTRAETNFIKSSDYHRIYDHMHDCRLLTPGYHSISSLNCMFSCPYNTISKLKEDIQEPWICNNYRIYLANPRHYKYYQPNTLTLLHVEDLGESYGKNTTDTYVELINMKMVEETGEPLFYLI